MKSEIEAKFLDIDFNIIRTQLLDIGAECFTPMRLMKRSIIDYPDRRMQKDKDAFIRVRDEGDKVTLCYKQFSELSIDGAKETELVVSSFEDTVKVFEAAGLQMLSFQESKRETWLLGSVEIMLDEWPWLEPYIEIEGSDEASIKDVSEKLGLTWANAVFGDVMVAYRMQYPNLARELTISQLPRVSFQDPIPAILEKARI